MTYDHDGSDIERWLHDGRVQLPIAVELLDPDILDERERRVIACLGAAILSIWNEIPAEVRKMLLLGALSSSTYDAPQLKRKVAMFLGGDKNP